MSITRILSPKIVTRVTKIGSHKEFNRREKREAGEGCMEWTQCEVCRGPTYSFGGLLSTVCARCVVVLEEFREDRRRREAEDREHQRKQEHEAWLKAKNAPKTATFDFKADPDNLP